VGVQFVLAAREKQSFLRVGLCDKEL